MSAVQHDSSNGLRAILVASILWGFLPMFWRQLETVPASEILAYRILSSALFLLSIIIYTQRWDEVRRALSSRAACLRLTCSAFIVGANWFLFIWAVNNGHILETSLGYYMSPLVNVGMGYLLLHERLNRIQWLAVFLAFCGVMWSLIAFGRFPWIGVTLAVSFSLYAFLRKTVAVEALPGLLIETLLLAPLSVAWIGWLAWNGQGVLLTPSWRAGLLLFLAGIVTTVPLGLFAYAARHVRLATLGLVQYISPTETFFIALWVYHEPVSSDRWITFAGIWCALLLLTWNTRHLLKSQRFAYKNKKSL